MPVLNTKGLIEARIKAIQDYHRKADGTYMRAEIDVSGGIDSAVMLMLLSKAIGPENITAVYQGINSSRASLDRAREVAKAAGVKLIECDWSGVIVAIKNDMLDAMGVAGYDRKTILSLMDKDPTIMGSLRSTFRAPMGRFANRLAGNGIRHGTGNNDEDYWLRFFQKGGDGEVDINSLALFSKGEVFQMALALGVPHSILTARPSPDLWGDNEKAGGQRDETEIKAYLGLSDVPMLVYSYIDLDTGEYNNVGLIERVSRFVDWQCDLIGAGHDPTLFDDRFDMNRDLNQIRTDILASRCFHGMDIVTVGLLLGAAKKVERETRHKENLALPTLGTRKELVDAGFLTNEFPKIPDLHVMTSADAGKTSIAEFDGEK